MRALACVVLALACAPAARAHRLDELLQGAFVRIEPGRVSVELGLTPGVAVADAVFALADSDRDGVVSPAEGAAFASRVGRELALRVDGEAFPLESSGSLFPSRDELRGGTAVIQLEYAATVPAAAPGTHRAAFRNGWKPVTSVYLANALVPKARGFAVTAQRRDTVQSELEVTYVVSADASPLAEASPSAAAPRPWRRAGVFLGLVAAFAGWAAWRRRGQGTSIRTR